MQYLYACHHAIAGLAGLPASNVHARTRIKLLGITSTFATGAAGHLMCRGMGDNI